MIVSCSQAGIVNPEHPGQGIANMKNAGFDNVLLNLSMYCTGRDLENFGKQDMGKKTWAKSRDSIDIFLHKCKESDIRITEAFAPYLLRDTKRGDLIEVLERTAEESIRLCGKAGCHYLVVRPLFAGVASGDEWLVNREYYLRLAKAAKEYNVMILLENQCRDVGGHLVRGICSDADTVNQWIDLLNEACGEERFGFCLDTGVCNLCGQDMHEFVTRIGRRVKMVVLRECDGQHESAGLPFTSVYQRRSRTDWLGLIRGLREIGFDGQLVLNIEDTAAAFSPILRPQLLVFAKSVAEYFKWQIEMENRLKLYRSIVLFGAGNMCRNYMKCYGEKYPPLFTCDNNQKLWGTSSYGLEVKPPDALKEIPDDCGVFICNIYYQEIEKQLRNMGIRNIEFFNDEYMPSFDFKRLKGV